MSAPLAPAVRRALQRIPVLVAAEIAVTDQDLRRKLGLDYSQISAAVAILVRQGRVDRCYGYLVLPADRSKPAPSASGSEAA